MAEKESSPFTAFLARLVRVPKREIDEQEQKYQDARKDEAPPAKPKEIVPRRSVG